MRSSPPVPGAGDRPAGTPRAGDVAGDRYHRRMPRWTPQDVNRDESRSLVPIAVTKDGELAARWAESLREAGIEADVEIGDAQSLIPASTLATAGGPVDSMFAYEVRVPAADRARAASTLAELAGPGGDGSSPHQPGTGVMLRGALIALAAGAVVVGVGLARLMAGP